MAHGVTARLGRCRDFILAGVRAIVLPVAGACLAGTPDLPPAQTLAQQRIEYDSGTTKTILELQPFRSQSRSSLRRADGTPGVATLTNLNPYINAWYLLTLQWQGDPTASAYHLEDARSQALRLLPGDPDTLRVAGADGSVCTLWTRRGDAPLETARRTRLPYAPLCEQQVYLRNPVAGHQTSLEQVTDFLRDRVWGGEQVISLVKETLYQDSFIERRGNEAAHDIAEEPASPLLPWAAAVAADRAMDPIDPQHLEIAWAAAGRQLLPGRWYSVANLAGVFVSVIAPEDIDAAILMGHERSVNPLDRVESGALVYLVGFDLDRLDLHFVLGTDHPRLDWSPRATRDPALPGPDGVASAAPLVTNGMVSPADAGSTVATFAGGFKRSHGAFRYGALAQRNHGSHYGFIEDGVIFSKLQPGLATVVVLDDGKVDARTWTLADNLLLPHVRYARQNGVPLIEYDPARRVGIPGDLVNRWGPGNWSGSANVDLRTLRAGLCLQDTGQRRFLIYGYFSAATPSAMARVFQAYHCRYALHLDMNALEHTYLALYIHGARQRIVEHLIRGMFAVDRRSGTRFVPRFLGFPDDRDFFYFTQRTASP
jgi:hypothetical protein